MCKGAEVVYVWCDCLRCFGDIDKVQDREYPHYGTGVVEGERGLGYSYIIVKAEHWCSSVVLDEKGHYKDCDNPPVIMATTRVPVEEGEPMKRFCDECKKVCLESRKLDADSPPWALEQPVAPPLDKKEIAKETSNIAAADEKKVEGRQGGWPSIFPYETLLEASAKDLKAPLPVDVGGNIGYDLERLQQAYPETAARLYLEDKPEALGRATCGEIINKAGYDFFTLQPIKGAYTYYMHSVLYDWLEEPASKILEMQTEALAPGFSNLLVYNYIAPWALARPHATAYDLTMMVVVAGKERTEENWRELLKSAEYAVKRIRTFILTVQGVV
ncbi:O-methyltransferase-domain-containing protein [Xylaria digitata]|nr:O-methyltransferase-domain-containing protein [Xylaria digitata]